MTGHIFEIHRFLKSKDIMLHDNGVAKQTCYLCLIERVYWRKNTVWAGIVNKKCRHLPTLNEKIKKRLRRMVR